MQEQDEITKINNFLNSMSPLIALHVKILLKKAGLEFEQEDYGPDMVFYIKSGEKEVKFFIYNLLMEIATIDRDERPLRFDENVRDFDYFKAKILRLIDSKLRILFPLLGEDNVDKALERIHQFANQYQRVRILKFDPKDSSQSHHNN